MALPSTDVCSAWKNGAIPGGGPGTISIRLPRAGPEIMEPELQAAEWTTEILKTKQLEKVLSNISDEARIDLKASHASKFLLQMMPWELTPPLTPPKTPAAVPFLWEEAPGKPKKNGIRSPSLTLQLPPRLLALHARMTQELVSCASHSSSRPSYSPHTKGTGCRRRQNSHSRYLSQNLSSSNRHYSQEKYTPVINVQVNPFHVKPSDSSSWTGMGKQKTQGSYPDSPVSPLCRAERSCSLSPSSDPFDNSPVNSFLFKDAENKAAEDYQLPFPYIDSFTPRTSPYRDLGPTDDDFENRLGLGVLVKSFSKAKTWTSWAKAKQKKDLLPMEPWAPTLATYFHRWEQSKDNSQSSDSFWGKQEGRYMREGSCEYGHVKGKRESTLNYKIAAAKSPQDPCRQDEMSEKNKRCRGLARKTRKQKAGRIFGRLRKSVRYFVAIYRAIHRSLSYSNGYGKKLRWDSKLLHYQSLR
eukprot:c25361_g1_i2 orf=92-1501(+)